MPIKSRTYLKDRFENGDIPTQDDFWDLIDSYIHENEDGVTVYFAPDTTIRFGIGETQPEAPLGIKAIGEDEDLISFHKPDGTTVWGINQNPTSGNIEGFNIQQKTSGIKYSRFFIEEKSGKGHIGIGTMAPTRPLHIEKNNPAGVTALKLKNLSSATATPFASYGWLLGHKHEAAVDAQNGSFSIHEEPALSTDPPIERVTLLPGGYFGINELQADTKLHVSVPSTSAASKVAFLPHTGIAQFGQVAQSLVFDYQTIQSRKIDGSTSAFVASALHLQELGGEIIIHGDELGQADSQRVVIKTDGFVGIGQPTPLEQLHVNGRIIVGDSTVTPSSATAGALRLNSAATVKVFEGWNGTAWIPFGGDNTVWEKTTNDNIRFIPEDSFVGIGMLSPAEPTATLHILEDTELETAGTSTAVRIVASSHFSTTSNPLPTPGTNDNRIGLDISCSVGWSNVSGAKNIGLLVSQVAGQTAVNENLAAVLNGNVVVGSITAGVGMVGTNGTNVLAIQNGATAPTTKIGASGNTNGIQIYSQSSDSNPAISIFHVMNGNGNIVKLFKGVNITGVHNGIVSTSSYGATEAAVINNMRVRIGDLEARLIAAGLLATAPPPSLPPPPPSA